MRVLTVNVELFQQRVVHRSETGQLIVSEVSDLQIRLRGQSACRPKTIAFDVQCQDTVEEIERRQVAEKVARQVNVAKVN